MGYGRRFCRGGLGSDKSWVVIFEAFDCRTAAGPVHTQPTRDSVEPSGEPGPVP